MSPAPVDNAVLGGGMLGLLTALRLAQRGESVVVLEREPIAGGLAAGFEIEPGLWLEKFYHHIFRSDRHAQRLIAELGLAERLVWKRPLTATLSGGRLRQLDSPISLLRFDALPLPDRLRMGAALAALKLLPNPRPLEGRTAEAWLRATLGSRAYATVWEPLLRAKFGRHADTVAMPWMWARIHDRSQRLGYLRGGFQQVYDRLLLAIEAAGGSVQLGVSVERATQAEATWLITTTQGELLARRLVSTLAPPLSARLCPQLPAEWLTRHDPGPALGAHCLVLALDRPLTDAYWINLNDPGFPFMAAVEHTNYLPADEYGGRHLLYLGNYRPMDDPLMSASREEVLAACVPHLARLNPSFDPTWLREAWMFRAPFAQPVVDVDYAARIPPFASPLPGLFTASMFGIYPHDRGQNYAIALAEQLVTQMPHLSQVPASRAKRP